MKAIMLVDFNEHIKKGDAPPKGREAHFVKVGLAKKVEEPAANPAPAAKVKGK